MGCGGVTPEVSEPTQVAIVHPNQPDGMTKITERPFLTPVEDGWAEAFQPPATASYTALVDTDDRMLSKPSAMVSTIKTGFLGGTEPINTFKVISAPVETLYVSFTVKLSPNWVGHPNSGVNKILHIFIAGINRVALSAQGTNAGALQPQLRLQQISSNGGFRNLAPNIVTGATISRGEWHRWDFIVITNTAGNADGKAIFWLDGVKVGEYADIGYVTATQTHNWTSINWAPTWGGTGNTVSADQWMAIDHIYISGR